MDRAWLVTGASSGFSRAISEAELAAGDVVVGAARRTEAPQDLGRTAQERGGAHPGDSSPAISRPSQGQPRSPTGVPH
ncbi:hypothetical protein SAMN04490357_1565 [Streptomyces misionensis]|uniref:Short chain dehydrogenase n=1 Tax=Streptomyces misionensis TaxID=67331 RepID=A0A1H4R1C8_9ACTN|nr:hypothetical protein SAMN04490357_1565 [Streptomyces misionensis]